MNNQNFDDNLLKIKKQRFLEVVKRTSKHLKVKEPDVKFWNCPASDGSEIAHFHPAEYLICISDDRLSELTFEQIEETATHEITHITDTKIEDNKHHSSDFYERKNDLSAGSWEPPGGVVFINGNGKLTTEKTKERKYRPNKTTCNYNLCNSRKNINQCVFCKKYFCEEHFKPKQPITDSYYKRFEEEGGHPCVDWVIFKEEEAKKQNEKYLKNLDKITKGESKLGNYRPNIPSKMASDEPVYKKQISKKYKNIDQDSPKKTEKEFEMVIGIKDNCYKCGIDISDVAYRCKYCGELYCANHKYAENHNCSVLYGTPKKEKAKPEKKLWPEEESQITTKENKTKKDSDGTLHQFIEEKKDIKGEKSKTDIIEISPDEYEKKNLKLVLTVSSIIIFILLVILFMVMKIKNVI